MLNKQTIPDKYAIPLLTGFVDFMSGATIFSTLNMNESYRQIEVAEEDRRKTAILIPFGSYSFKKIPMGLTTAGNAFQRFMNEILRELDFVYVYIDDILIFSKSCEEHLARLAQVFARLNHYELILNKNKCEFCFPKFKLLEH